MADLAATRYRVTCHACGSARETGDPLKAFALAGLHRRLVPACPFPDVDVTDGFNPSGSVFTSRGG